MRHMTGAAHLHCLLRMAEPMLGCTQRFMPSCRHAQLNALRKIHNYYTTFAHSTSWASVILRMGWCCRILLLNCLKEPRKRIVNGKPVAEARKFDDLWEVLELRAEQLLPDAPVLPLMAALQRGARLTAKPAQVCAKVKTACASPCATCSRNCVIGHSTTSCGQHAKAGTAS